MTRTISVGFLTGLVLLSVVAGTTTVAQERDAVSELQEQVDSLERQIDRRETRVEVEDGGYGCGIAILFGAFCALWAQNTGRNPWLWFVMGAIFSCITVLILLTKNADDLAGKATPPEPPREPDSVGFREEDES